MTITYDQVFYLITDRVLTRIDKQVNNSPFVSLSMICCWITWWNSSAWCLIDLSKTRTRKVTKHINTVNYHTHTHTLTVIIKQLYLFWTSLKFFKYFLWVQPWNRIQAYDVSKVKNSDYRVVQSFRHASFFFFHLRLIPENRRQILQLSVRPGMEANFLQ